MNNENSNPMIDKANQDLMGGQDGVVTPGVMQGVGPVTNESPVPGVVSIPSAPPVDNAAGPMMPGMDHSGINANTMAMPEAPVDNSSINPVNPTNEVNGVQAPQVNPFLSKVEMTDEPKVMPMETPNVNDNAIKMPEVPISNPEPMVNGNIGSVMMGNNDTTDFNANPTPNSVLMPEAPKVDNISNVMVPPIMENNEGPTESVNSAVDSANNNEPVNNIGNDMDNATVSNNVMPQDNAMQGVQQPATFSNPAPALSVNGSFMPKKKFPLSTREMILIGIALVGIVVVLIMYL